MLPRLDLIGVMSIPTALANAGCMFRIPVSKLEIGSVVNELLASCFRRSHMCILSGRCPHRLRSWNDAPPKLCTSDG
jgi:hypothetical protein